MWQIKWLRRFVRRHTKPIQHQKAVNWKERLSLVYAIIAWNAFGVVCYMMYTGRKDWAKYYGFKSEADALVSPGKQWARTLNIENAKIIRLSGLNVIQEEEITRETESINRSTQEQATELS